VATTARATPRGKVRAQVREADVEIYSIGIFDPTLPHPRSAPGPMLANVSEVTGGRLFRVDDIDERATLPKDFHELRNQYVIGYRPGDLTRTAVA